MSLLEIMFCLRQIRKCNVLGASLLANIKIFIQKKVFLSVHFAGKQFGLPYMGKAIAAARAVLPRITTVCDVF